jgi:tRNA dimethylallyltransferase
MSTLPAQKHFALLAPTASGKTALSIALAKRFDFEIVNADGYQVFRHMNIGTAKPTPDEQAQVPHHLFDIKNPDEGYSAHAFAQHARQTLVDIEAKGKRALLVGGSGFYLRALQTPHPDVPPGTIETDDLNAAFDEIIAFDPDLKDQLEANDSYRIARALFLVREGLRPSSIWQAQLSQPDVVDLTVLGLHVPRPQLYQRINTRVEQMFEQGLVTETQEILQRFPQARPRLEKTIGYAQSLLHLDQVLTLAQAIEQTQIKTRNYAKRQMTWIRNQTNLKGFDFENAFDAVSCYVESLV